MTYRTCIALFVTVFLGAAVAGPSGETPILPYRGKVELEKPVSVRNRVSETVAPGKQIRICSYNIQDFTDGVGDPDGRTRRVAGEHARLAAGSIEEIDPDIIVFQELENKASLALINNALTHPYPVAFITRFDQDTDRPLNIGVLSRLELNGLREFDFVNLEGLGRPPRGVLSFVVRLSGRRTLLVYVVHLKSNWGDRPKNVSKRYNALRLIAEDASRIQKSYPRYTWEIVVLGDFNVDPDMPSFASDTSLEPLSSWVDLWRGMPIRQRVTLPTRHGDPAQEFPPTTFDRFLVSTALTVGPWRAGVPQVLQKGVVTSDVTVKGGEKGQISDHYPVYLDLLR